MGLNTDNMPEPEPSFAELQGFAPVLDKHNFPPEIQFDQVNAKSGNMLACAYHPETRRMLVVFKGKAGKDGAADAAPSLYAVEGVQPEMYGDFAMTFPDQQNSSGSFYHNVFRKNTDAYTVTRIA